MELWARICPVILPKFRFPRKFKDLLHAVNIRHGTNGFTSLRRKAYWGFFRPKDPKASAGFEPAILGTKGQHATEAAIYVYWTQNVFWFSLQLVSETFLIIGRIQRDTINRLTPNDPYMGRTAPLTSKRCILYIYSTNIGTDYFKHALYSPLFFFSSKCSLFHNANLFGSCIIHILYTGCSEIKKNNVGAKRLKNARRSSCKVPVILVGFWWNF